MNRRARQRLIEVNQDARCVAAVLASRDRSQGRRSRTRPGAWSYRRSRRARERHWVGGQDSGADAEAAAPSAMRHRRARVRISRHASARGKARPFSCSWTTSDILRSGSRRCLWRCECSRSNVVHAWIRPKEFRHGLVTDWCRDARSWQLNAEGFARWHSMADDDGRRTLPFALVQDGRRGTPCPRHPSSTP